MVPQTSPHRNPTRRELLASVGGGFGSLALIELLHRNAVGGAPLADSPANNTRPPGGGHHPARARRVIQLFMNGGASQQDLFDFKPELVKRHGQPFDPGTGDRIEAATSAPGNVLGPQFKFRRHGQCGRWVSELFPHLAQHVDEMAFLMAMTSRTNVHGPASYLMNTGSLFPGFPCFGAWVSYGLGSETENLPSFVVLPDARGLPYNQKGNFGAGFLPVKNQGTIIQAGAPEPIANLRPPPSAGFVTTAAERDGAELLARLNRDHYLANDQDSRLEGRIRAYELAARMQLSAPEAFDLKSETATTRELYGLNESETEDFGRRCLLARRLVERGVRFVQVWSGAGGPSNNWDNHTNIARELPPVCRATDRPISALLRDLRARGLLDDTLVLWSTEFGRMPFSQSSVGRDHNGGTSVGWLAGAGIRGGTSFGESDPWSWKALRDPATNYDLHATALHLLGIDHTRLTVRHNGADRRLTDVHGRVLSEILDA